mgnify:FL=1
MVLEKAHTEASIALKKHTDSLDKLNSAENGRIKAQNDAKAAQTLGKFISL